MKGYCDKKGYFLAFLVLGIFLLASTFQVAAQGARTVESDLQTKPLVSDVDSHIAGMRDVPVRQAYAQKLKQEATVNTVLPLASKLTRPRGEVSATLRIRSAKRRRPME